MCMAWMNDVASWTTTKIAIEWMGLNFLKQTGYSDINQPFDAVQKLGFITEEGSRLQAQSPIKIGWLTSLWTLQEAILCPDMELLDAGWSKLTDAWDSAVSIRTLMVFINQCQQNNQIQWPEGPWELIRLSEMSNLSAVFLSESPAVVCSVTNLRVCSGPPESRAAAIMSAIGVTDWWHTRTIPVANPFGDWEIPSQV